MCCGLRAASLQTWLLLLLAAHCEPRRDLLEPNRGFPTQSLRPTATSRPKRTIQTMTMTMTIRPLLQLAAALEEIQNPELQLNGNVLPTPARAMGLIPLPRDASNQNVLLRDTLLPARLI